MATDAQRREAQRELARRELARREADTDPEGIESSKFAATVMGINQGATFGFADEIAAGLTALAVSPFSDKDFGQIYDETLETERANLAAAQEQFPKTTLGTTIAGGAVSGGLGARAGMGILRNVPRLPRVAAIGGAEGALFGAGTAEDDKLKGAAIGGGIGAVAGPVVTGLGSVLARTGKKIAAPIMRMAGNTPKRQAARIVERAVDLDDLGAASVQDELKRLGPEATLADLGENLSGVARAVTGKPGRARTIASALLRDRQQTQKGRLLKAAGVDFDIDDFKRSFHTTMNNRKSAAAPLYDEAYGSSLEITPNLATLMKRPTMQKVLKKASVILQDEGGGGSHVRLMDAAKRELDDMTGKALRGGKRETARRLINMKNDLLREVDSQVPSYKQARDLFSSEAGMRDSASLGRSLFSSRIDLDDTAVAIEGMGAGDRQAFQIGAIRGLIDKLEKTPETRNAAQKLIESPRQREILSMVFPDSDDMNRFLQTARAESQFSFTKNRIMGGSPTTPRLEEAADLTREASAAAALRGGDATGMAIQFLRSVGLGDVSEDTLEEVSRLLFSRALPKKAAAQILRPSVQIPEIPRQGAIAGGVGAVIGQRDE